MVKYNTTVRKGKFVMFNKALRNISAVLATVFYRIKYRFRVVGAENVPKEGGVLICANHRKAEDPVLIYVALRKRYIYFFAKQALTEGRFLKWYMGDVLGVKAVSHTASDLGAVKWGVNKLKNGEVVGIFPEGTRNRTENDLLEFQHGAAIIAYMAKTKVVTATINCNRKLFSRCEVIFSEPLDFTELYKQRFNDDVKNEITNKIYENVRKSLKK